MALPEVTLTELDGAIGATPSGGLPPMAVLGVTDSGAVDTPAAYSRTTTLVSERGGGPAVEAAAYHIETRSRPIILISTGSTVTGSYPGDAETTQTGSGTSVATVDNVGTAPNDDYEAYLVVVTGGTVGTAGIEFRYSLDGGRTLSPVIALGTDTDSRSQVAAAYWWSLQPVHW